MEKLNKDRILEMFLEIEKDVTKDHPKKGDVKKNEIFKEEKLRDTQVAA